MFRSSRVRGRQGGDHAVGCTLPISCVRLRARWRRQLTESVSCRRDELDGHWQSQSISMGRISLIGLTGSREPLREALGRNVRAFAAYIRGLRPKVRSLQQSARWRPRDGCSPRGVMLNATPSDAAFTATAYWAKPECCEYMLA